MYLPIKMNYGVDVTWWQQNRSCSLKEKSHRSVDTYFEPSAMDSCFEKQDKPMAFLAFIT